MEAHDVVAERPGNGDSSVWVAERNEMRVLGEAIHHGEHQRFATGTRKPLHKIHRDVRPDRAWHFQWLQQPGRMKVLSFVALADRTALDVVTHQPRSVGLKKDARSRCKVFWAPSWPTP